MEFDFLEYRYLNYLIMLLLGLLLLCSGAVYCLQTENGEEVWSREHWARPVIHQGVLYIRHGEALMAYDIKDPNINTD
jgi:hypothetical protein